MLANSVRVWGSARAGQRGARRWADTMHTVPCHFSCDRCARLYARRREFNERFFYYVDRSTSSGDGRALLSLDRPPRETARCDTPSAFAARGSSSRSPPAARLAA